MSGVYSGTTVWAIMDMMAKIYQVRDDGRAASTSSRDRSTNYAASRSAAALPTSRVDGRRAVARAERSVSRRDLPAPAAAAGQADNGQRQVISYGAVPGPRPLPVLGIGGLITSA
jgi:hypothetical protein